MSDTIQRPPGVALQHGLDFIGWIKLGNEKVQKLNMRGTLDERVECNGIILYQE